ncbi:hypothetical protein ABKN59_011053 [Abortiporus biennis]
MRYFGYLPFVTISLKMSCLKLRLSIMIHTIIVARVTGVYTPSWPAFGSRRNGHMTYSCSTRDRNLPGSCLETDQICWLYIPRNMHTMNMRPEGHADRNSEDGASGTSNCYSGILRSACSSGSWSYGEFPKSVEIPCLGFAGNSRFVCDCDDLSCDFNVWNFLHVEGGMKLLDESYRICRSFDSRCLGPKEPDPVTNSMNPARIRGSPFTLNVYVRDGGPSLQIMPTTVIHVRRLAYLQVSIDYQPVDTNLDSLPQSPHLLHTSNTQLFLDIVPGLASADFPKARSSTTVVVRSTSRFSNNDADASLVCHTLRKVNFTGLEDLYAVYIRTTSHVTIPGFPPPQCRFLPELYIRITVPGNI